MSVINCRAPAIIVTGIVAGSFAGALLRGAASLVLTGRSNTTLIMLLLVSTLGGLLLGVLLSLALTRADSRVWKVPLVVALIAAIGSFGAAAALDLIGKEASPWPYWRDAVLNIGVTILAARAALALSRRRYVA